MIWNRILAIGAHPDDIEYGCFGFLASHMKNADIFCYVCTSGSAGDLTSGDHRILESKEALALLKPTTTLFAKNKGIHITEYEKISNELYNFIQIAKPDLILTHSPHDTHQEHRLLYDITMTAARRSKASILKYGILSNTLNYHPQVFKDISAEYALKRKALDLHKSQSKKYYMSDEYLKIFHQNQYVNLNEIKLSESFEIERLFL